MTTETMEQAPQTTETRPAAQQMVRIQPKPGWAAVDFRELWLFRELMWFLAMRDVKVRYKQTLLGVAWAVIVPVMYMVVFGVFFGPYIHVDKVSYSVFTLCGIVPWQLFANTLSQSSNSLVNNQQLLTKIYFPRLIIPISAVLSNLVDFAIALAILAAVMVFFHVPLSPSVLALPLFVLLAVAAALGAGLWLSALNVRYRDIRYVVPFLLQIGMFASAVISPTTQHSPRVQQLMALNPMVSVVEGFRWCLLGGTGSPQVIGPGQLLLISTAAIVVLLVSGLYYFRRMEKTFADVI